MGRIGDGNGVVSGDVSRHGIVDRNTVDRDRAGDLFCVVVFMQVSRLLGLGRDRVVNEFSILIKLVLLDRRRIVGAAQLIDDFLGVVNIADGLHLSKIRAVDAVIEVKVHFSVPLVGEFFDQTDRMLQDQQCVRRIDRAVSIDVGHGFFLGGHNAESDGILQSEQCVGGVDPCVAVDVAHHERCGAGLR